MMETLADYVAIDIVTRYVAALDSVALSGHAEALDEDVDILWHLHVLDLEDYLAFCRERYGRVILHKLPDSPKPLTALSAQIKGDCEAPSAVRVACGAALQCSGPPKLSHA
jgi:hypothetical protein